MKKFYVSLIVLLIASNLVNASFGAKEMFFEVLPNVEVTLEQGIPLVNAGGEECNLIIISNEWIQLEKEVYFEGENLVWVPITINPKGSIGYIHEVLVTLESCESESSEIGLSVTYTKPLSFSIVNEVSVTPPIEFVSRDTEVIEESIPIIQEEIIEEVIEENSTIIGIKEIVVTPTISLIQEKELFSDINPDIMFIIIVVGGVIGVFTLFYLITKYAYESKQKKDKEEDFFD